jgi:hypothetical protein
VIIVRLNGLGEGGKEDVKEKRENMANYSMC